MCPNRSRREILAEQVQNLPATLTRFCPAGNHVPLDVLDVERYEMVIEQAAGESRTPDYVRVNDLCVEPDRIDALVAFLRERVPSITSQRGCRALLMGVNRMTGRCFVSTVWATAEDRLASEAAVIGLRQPVHPAWSGGVRGRTSH